MLVCCRGGELRRAVEHEVHRVQRIEHRIQKRAAALPAGLRRLLAGGVAVSGLPAGNQAPGVFRRVHCSAGVRAH